MATLVFPSGDMFYVICVCPPIGCKNKSKCENDFSYYLEWCHNSNSDKQNGMVGDLKAFFKSLSKCSKANFKAKILFSYLLFLSEDANMMCDSRGSNNVRLIFILRMLRYCKVLHVNVDHCFIVFTRWQKAKHYHDNSASVLAAGVLANQHQRISVYSALS